MKDYYVLLYVTNPQSGKVHTVTEFVNALSLEDSMQVAILNTLHVWRCNRSDIEVFEAGLRRPGRANPADDLAVTVR